METSDPNRMRSAAYRKRVEFFVLVVLACVLAAILFNNILSYIDSETGDWTSQTLIPVMKPVGSDFRVGLYRTAQAFLQGKNPYREADLIYPPLAVYAGLPFNLVPEWRGYLVQVGLIFILNLAALTLLARLAVHVFVDEAHETGTVIFLTVLMGIAVESFSSYGFLFNIERGNFDVYPLFLSALFLWLLWKHPRRMWLQVLVISAAAHLKVYPLIFYALVVWKHGWKSLLPLAAVNLGFLLCLGPGNALAFIETIAFQSSARPSTWIGNHSAYAYAAFWDWQPENPGITATEMAFLAIPCLIWAGTAFVLYRRGYSLRNAAWLYALSVPLVNLIPRVSYDYKLVWFYAPAVLLLAYQMNRFVNEGKKRAVLEWLLLALLLLMASRSCGVTPDILASKYPYILLLEMMTAVSIITDRPRSQTV